jgi:single-stranded-DNA-specific exonuclease
MTSPSPSLPWIEPPPLTIPPEFQIAVGGHPLLAETLLRRGIYDPGSGKGLPAVQAFLNPDLYTPNPAADLPGMEETTSRLQRAILIGERIGVWGDFDVDGQTATTLLVETLQGLGADVIYHARHQPAQPQRAAPERRAVGADLRHRHRCFGSRRIRPVRGL